MSYSVFDKLHEISVAESIVLDQVSQNI